MIDLTSEMILEIHDAIIERYGGLSGILCLGTIDYLVAKINNEPDCFRKAATALHLIVLHPFNDGQKRTGFLVADTIMRMNNLCISANRNDICEFLRGIAEYNCDLDKIGCWLRENVAEI